MAVAAELVPPKKAEYYKKEVQRYDKEKVDIKKEADSLEAEFRKANEASERMMAPHYRMAQAMTFIQIAISLASITVLTRKKWLFGVAGGGFLRTLGGHIPRKPGRPFSGGRVSWFFA